MSVWRRKVIEIAPELKHSLQNESIYIVFSELLDLLEKAHLNKEITKAQKIYDFAEWCFQQKSKDLWNAAGVSFYEHLGDNDILLTQFPKCVRKNIYIEIRDLLNRRLSDEKMKYLDKEYLHK